MKTAAVIISLLSANLISAQSDRFKEIPIKGKIKSLEILKKLGDSLSGKTQVIESYLFDETGQIVSTKLYSDYIKDSFPLFWQELRVNNPNHRITYSYRGSINIIEIIGIFNPDRLGEYVHPGGGNGPYYYHIQYDSFTQDSIKKYKNLDVFLDSMNKFGKLIESKSYYWTGEKLSETKFNYDEKQRLIRSERFCHTRELNETIASEDFKYNKKGNLIEKITFSKVGLLFTEREVYKYNKKNELMEYKKYIKGYGDYLLEAYYQYSEKYVRGAKVLRKTNMLYSWRNRKNFKKVRNQQKHSYKRSIPEHYKWVDGKKVKTLGYNKFIEEGTFYNSEGKERVFYNYVAKSEENARIETEYFQSGYIKTKYYYNIGNILIKRIDFIDDANNNWKEWTERTTKYILMAEYYK